MRWATTLVLLAVAGVASGGCARRSIAIPVSVGSGRPSKPVPRASLRSYESAVPAIARILVADLGLPLPAGLTVFVYPTDTAYATGLAQFGHMPAERAARIAGYAVAVGQRRVLFINDGALRGACAGAWLGLIAHELTHAAQYELSGGRRGRSEQWLREGMADWVAARVLDRLGIRDGRYHREHALDETRRGRRLLDPHRIDLLALGPPLGWEEQHLRVGGHLMYDVAFLLTDDLIRRRRFESLAAYFRAFATSNDRFGNFSRAFGVSLRAFADEAFARLSGDLARGDEPGAPRSTEPRRRDDVAPASPGPLDSPSCASDAFATRP